MKPMSCLLHTGTCVNFKYMNMSSFRNIFGMPSILQNMPYESEGIILKEAARHEVSIEIMVWFKI